MMTPQDALKVAIRIAGGAGAAADELKISRQAIWKWDQAPVERVADLERISLGKVTRYELRPDIFGPAPTAKRVAA